MKKPDNPLQRAQRCAAHSKRTGLRCGAPAVKGKRVCRMHGAGGGAPKGERNGKYRHGDRTQEAEAVRAAAQALMRESRSLLQSLSEA